MEDIVRLNRCLFQPEDRQIILSQTGNLPHLSLLMCGLPVKRLETVKAKLRALAASFCQFHLNIDKIVYRNECTSLNIENMKDLRHLHETLIYAYGDYMETTVTGSMFNHDTVISEASINYVNSYGDQGTREHYWPHITLGYGKLPVDTRFPQVIGFDKIGLYHLGNHCTCSKNIFTTTLLSG